MEFSGMDRNPELLSNCLVRRAFRRLGDGAIGREADSGRVAAQRGRLASPGILPSASSASCSADQFVSTIVAAARKMSCVVVMCHFPPFVTVSFRSEAALSS